MYCRFQFLEWIRKIRVISLRRVFFSVDHNETIIHGKISAKSCDVFFLENTKRTMNYERELSVLWKLLNYLSIGRHCLHSFFSAIELIPLLKFNYFICLSYHGFLTNLTINKNSYFINWCERKFQWGYGWFNEVKWLKRRSLRYNSHLNKIHIQLLITVSWNVKSIGRLLEIYSVMSITIYNSLTF